MWAFGSSAIITELVLAFADHCIAPFNSLYQAPTMGAPLDSYFFDLILCQLIKLFTVFFPMFLGFTKEAKTFQTKYTLKILFLVPIKLIDPNTVPCRTK